MEAFRLFVTCENTDDLPYIVQETGEDGLVIGTDYGHTDTVTASIVSLFPETIRNFRRQALPLPASDFLSSTLVCQGLPRRLPRRQRRAQGAQQTRRLGHLWRPEWAAGTSSPS